MPATTNHQWHHGSRRRNPSAPESPALPAILRALKLAVVPGRPVRAPQLDLIHRTHRSHNSLHGCARGRHVPAETSEHCKFIRNSGIREHSSCPAVAATHVHAVVTAIARTVLPWEFGSWFLPTPSAR